MFHIGDIVIAGHRADVTYGIVYKEADSDGDIAVCHRHLDYEVGRYHFYKEGECAIKIYSWEYSLFMEDGMLCLKYKDKVVKRQRLESFKGLDYWTTAIIFSWIEDWRHEDRVYLFGR